MLYNRLGHLSAIDNLTQALNNQFISKGNIWTLPPSMHHKLKETIDIVWKTMNKKS